MTRRGVWLFPNRPAGELVDAIVAADQLGLDEVWLADEGVARAPMAVLAAAATQTDRIRLAAGITSPALRHPGAIAASIATVDELSDGRAILGLGLGGELSLAPLAIRVDRPVAVLREAIETARSVLARVETARYRPPAHAMPARDVPIWVGARGPQLVRTAARLADGVFLSGCSTEQHAAIIGNARSVGGTEYALYQSAHASPGNDTELAWSEVGDMLAAEVERWRPTSIGINLVEPAQDRNADLGATVERAAALLLAIPVAP